MFLPCAHLRWSEDVHSLAEHQLRELGGQAVELGFDGLVFRCRVFSAEFADLRLKQRADGAADPAEIDPEILLLTNAPVLSHCVQ
jgi:hypothetical protein